MLLQFFDVFERDRVMGEGDGENEKFIFLFCNFFRSIHRFHYPVYLLLRSIGPFTFYFSYENTVLCLSATDSHISMFIAYIAMRRILVFIFSSIR